MQIKSSMTDDESSNIRKFKHRIGQYKRPHVDGDENQDGSVGIASQKRAASNKLRKNQSTQGSQDETSISSPLSQERLDHWFFDQDCSTLSQKLLGCQLIRKLPDGSVVSGMIVETEAYLGGDDKASHSYGNKATERNRAMFMAPGTAYVYQIYGIHFCFNVSSRGDGAAVLIRALQPMNGINHMTKLRLGGKQKCKTNMTVKKLCNGPAKLCQALAINKSLNCVDLCKSEELWIQPRQPDSQLHLVSAKRIGVEYAGHYWASQPLRFYMNDNPYVSVIAKNTLKS